MAGKKKMAVERYPVDRRKLKEACTKAGTTIAKLGLSLGLSDSYFDNRISRNQLDKQNILFLESELGITYDQIMKDISDDTDGMEPKKEADPVLVELFQQLIQEMREIKLELREMKEQKKEMMAQLKEMKEVWTN